ncbi:MAG: phytanoyl-CoA dioxygenase family protein [Chroococcidiopsidaceae cyanobacterium CP_BM_RX_35]|nr:phytanoyl-CoA dioxygenase family protein [Chroococcidiopsidaceae cyanobacterium CP_BM_RX_35]
MGKEITKMDTLNTSLVPEKDNTVSNRDSFEIVGYIVCKDLVSTDLIDKLVDLYKEQIVPSKDSFLRQMTNKFEPNELNEFGYVKQDFLDVHNYKKFPEFSSAVKEIICSDDIQNVLKQITNNDAFNWMQSLLFDLNRETIPHHDSYYLDTIPGGGSVAVWIALEDIDEKAGRFYLVPNSVDAAIHDLPHPLWLGKMKEYFDANKDKVHAPPLNKGDAIFWKSRIVHGAFPIVDPSLSRKSLTSHFVPSDSKYGNLFYSKDYVELGTYKGVKMYSATPPDSNEWTIIGDYKVGQ